MMETLILAALAVIAAGAVLALLIMLPLIIEAAVRLVPYLVVIAAFLWLVGWL